MKPLVAALAALSGLLMSCGGGAGGPSGAQCDAAPSPVAVPADLPRLSAASPSPEADRYIVSFSDAAQAEAWSGSSGATGRTLQALATPDAAALVRDGAARVKRLGGKVLRTFPKLRAVAAQLDEAAVRQLRLDARVRKIEKDPKRFLLGQTVPWGIAEIGAPDAWAATPSLARGARVCVIDSGVYAAHEDLQLTSSASGYPDNWNEDRCGHGTHVAGIIAALDNSLGVVGASPRGADMFAVRVFGDDCSWTYASELADAVTRCADAGARVVNMSLGGYEPSEVERDAFAAAWRRGVLLVAAAGNDGDIDLDYPASYPSVISVGAIDSDRKRAAFSQHNPQVDLVAPGVRVVSTVPFISRHTLTVEGVTIEGTPIQNAGNTPPEGVRAPLVDGGTCNAVGDYSGRIVLCRRGGATFADKVANAQRGGAVAAVIYDDSSGVFAGTLGDKPSSLPAFGVSDADGRTLLGWVGRVATLISLADVEGSGYAAFTGTSMAAPHVTGVASFLMGQEPTATNAEVRAALESTALDLGAPGVDDEYGHGLVQVGPALQALRYHTATSTGPHVGFFTSCDGLQCTFNDASIDDTGEIVHRTFETDDGASSTEVRFSHAFASTGVHTVTLTATNAAGRSARIALPVSIIGLTARAGAPKEDGSRDVELDWDGVATERVIVMRDGKTLTTTHNGGAAVDHLEATTKPVTYRVCSAGGESCSSEVTVLPPCS